MASFGHGGNAKEISRKNKIEYDKIIDFSANINPLGMADSIKKGIIENLNQIEKYPDITYFELKHAISKFENISSENIILGNGAAEVVFNTVRGIKPKNALVLAPTFSEYEEAIKAVNGNVIYYKLMEENNFHIQEDILDYINSKLDLIFICNPNNPTGVITPKDLLIRILLKAKRNNVSVIIDESFLDFMEEDLSMTSYLDEYDNLLIIKSLTKFFALPGLRIGYGMCSNTALKKELDKIVPAWNVNILAEVAAKAGINDEKYIKESRKYLLIEKKYLYDQLRLINKLKVYEPSVILKLFKTVITIHMNIELLKNNNIIRSCSNYNCLNNSYYRIAVRNHEENSKLLKNLKKIFEENGKLE
jgi:threonine-phosphate decarboxylase